MKRRLRGVPLLICAAGAIVTIGCGGGSSQAEEPLRPPVGNLMPPPAITVCVAVEPPDATVRIDGLPAGDDGCAVTDDDGAVTIEAEREGYLPVITNVPREQVEAGSVPITLVPLEPPAE